MITTIITLCQIVRVTSTDRGVRRSDMLRPELVGRAGRASARRRTPAAVVRGSRPGPEPAPCQAAARAAAAGHGGLSLITRRAAVNCSVASSATAVTDRA